LSAADWAAGRASRAATERLLEAATGCRVVALGGAEATGGAEVAYGAGQGADGLVMVATIGAGGVGVALFEDGARVRAGDGRRERGKEACGGARHNTH
jgi:predicted NBD/HSP70 family sugar kinase